MPGNIRYQFAAPAKYRIALVFIDVVDAHYSYGNDASVVYSNVNCRAYS